VLVSDGANGVIARNGVTSSAANTFRVGDSADEVVVTASPASGVVAVSDERGTGTQNLVLYGNDDGMLVQAFRNGGPNPVRLNLFATGDIPFRTNNTPGKSINVTLAGVSPETSDDSDLGATLRAWRSVFVATSIVGSTDAKALQVLDPQGVSVSSTSGPITLSSGGQEWQQTSGDLRGPSQVTTGGTPALLRPPRYVAAGGVTLATCNAGIEGSMFYYNDTGDAQPGVFCSCIQNGAGSYVWRLVADPASACGP
jgi:hypothetical protein